MYACTYVNSSLEFKLFLFNSADVYDNTWQRLEPLGIDTECLGGGRILHEPDKKHIRVYGYSQVQTIAVICISTVRMGCTFVINFIQIDQTTMS